MLKLFILLLLTVFLIYQPVSADYFCKFTQVDVQPRLGRIAIHRSLVRTPKYVDWMTDNRKTLREDGIYVDAEFGEIDVITRHVEMDGQKIELELTTEHTKTKGIGSALPSNHMKITIDGVLVYDGLIGLARSQGTEVFKIEIIPAEHMINIDAAQVTGGPGYRWEYLNDATFWYGLKSDKKVVCDMCWIYAQFPDASESE